MLIIPKCKNTVESEDWGIIKSYPSPKLKELVDQNYITPASAYTAIKAYDTNLITEVNTAINIKNAGNQNKLTVGSTITPLFLNMLFDRYNDSHISGSSFIVDYAEIEDWKAPKIVWAEYDDTWKTLFIQKLIEVVPQFWGALVNQIEKNFYTQKEANLKRLSSIDIYNTAKGPNQEITTPIEQGALFNYVSDQLSNLHEMSLFDAAIQLETWIKPETLWERFFKPFQSLFTKLVYKSDILVPTIPANNP